MFIVTNAAVARLARELGKLEISANKVIRFLRREDGMHLRVSEVQPGDRGFSHEGKVVLVVDADLAARLTRRTLDLKETSRGTKLSLAPTA